MRNLAIVSLSLFVSTAQAAPQFEIVPGDGTCPNGKRLATLSEVQKNANAVCSNPAMGYSP